MAPHAKAEEADAADRADHRAVTKDRLARKRGEQVRRHAHARKNRDVHLRMAEEPEQMLPQKRRAALVPGDDLVGNNQPAGNKKARARKAIEQQAGCKPRGARRTPASRGSR